MPIEIIMPRFSGVEFLGTASKFRTWRKKKFFGVCSSSPQQFAKEISCMAMKRTANKCINNDGQ